MWYETFQEDALWLADDSGKVWAQYEVFWAYIKAPQGAAVQIPHLGFGEHKRELKTFHTSFWAETFYDHWILGECYSGEVSTSIEFVCHVNFHLRTAIIRSQVGWAEGLRLSWKFLETLDLRLMSVWQRFTFNRVCLPSQFPSANRCHSRFQFHGFGTRSRNAWGLISDSV